MAVSILDADAVGCLLDGEHQRSVLERLEMVELLVSWEHHSARLVPPFNAPVLAVLWLLHTVSRQRLHYSRWRVAADFDQLHRPMRPKPGPFSLRIGCRSLCILAVCAKRCHAALVHHVPAWFARSWRHGLRAHQQDPTSPAAELHFKKIKRQKIVGEKGSIDMEFIRSRRRFIVDGIDVLTEIVKQAMNKDEEIPF